MTNRIDLDEAYMRMAEVWAQRSYARRSKVGALLVKDNQIISDGYNGMPSGMDHDLIETYDESGALISNPLVIHAEANVFDKISKHGASQGAAGATLYITLSPCLECAKRIINNKIKRVVYRNEYRINTSLEVLRNSGIEVVKLERKHDDIIETIIFVMLSHLAHVKSQNSEVAAAYGILQRLLNSLGVDYDLTTASPQASDVRPEPAKSSDSVPSVS